MKIWARVRIRARLGPLPKRKRPPNFWWPDMPLISTSDGKRLRANMHTGGQRRNSLRLSAFSQLGGLAKDEASRALRTSGIGAADCGENRQAARAIEPPSDLRTIKSLRRHIARPRPATAL